MFTICSSQLYQDNSVVSWNNGFLFKATNKNLGPVNEDGLSHPNVGVLLLTKEAQEGGDTIRTPPILSMLIKVLSHWSPSTAVVCIHSNKYGYCICQFPKAGTEGKMCRCPMKSTYGCT